MKQLYYIALLLIFGSSSVISTNFITQKLAGITTFFTDLKQINAEHDKAYKEHILNVTKNCAQEIDAFRKAAEKVSKINRLMDPLLYNLYCTEREDAAEKYAACVKNTCKDTLEKWENTRKQLGAKLGQLANAIIIIGVASYSTLVFGPMLFKKIARRPYETRINELINKYSLDKTEKVKNTLALCMRQQNKEHIPQIPTHVWLSDRSFIDALAEAFYGSQACNDNASLFLIFENQLYQQRSRFTY